MVTAADENGNSVAERELPNPGFGFGIFDFQELADWLLERHAYCARWLIDTVDIACAESNGDSEAVHAFRGVGLSVAIDTAYLAMLSLAVAYSVRDDLLDGGFSPRALIEAEPFRRARYMLELHAGHLPVKIDGTQMLDQRAGLVASVFMPVSMTGFDGQDPIVREAHQKLPAEVITALESHEFAEMPLCQMMAVSFWQAFRIMMAEGSPSLQWQQVLDDFWKGWTYHLLDVDFALRQEDLQANERLAEEDDDEAT